MFTAIKYSEQPLQLIFYILLIFFLGVWLLMIEEEHRPAFHKALKHTVYSEFIKHESSQPLLAQYGTV